MTMYRIAKTTKWGQATRFEISKWKRKGVRLETANKFAKSLWVILKLQITLLGVIMMQIKIEIVNGEITRLRRTSHEQL